MNRCKECVQSVEHTIILLWPVTYLINISLKNAEIFSCTPIKSFSSNGLIEI